MTRVWTTQRQVAHYSAAGGLPGICFHREDRLKAKKLESHLDTLLSRDLQSVYRSRFTPVARLEHHESAAGAEIPFVIHFARQGRIGLMPVVGDLPTNGQRKTARWFLKRYEGSKVVFVATEGGAQVFDSREFLVPVRGLF